MNDKGFNGGLQQFFNLELYEAQSTQLKANLSSNFPAFAVKGLEPGQTYTAFIYALNKKARSDPCILSVDTVTLPLKILTREKTSKNA
jgi:hypothetical protein